MTGAPVLSARGLSVRHRTARGPAAGAAVDGVDVDLHAGRALGLVGPSGAGKSTLVRALVGLDSPRTGTVQLHGVELGGLDSRTGRARRRAIQMVFQEPRDALDPRWAISRSIGEPLRARGERVEPRAIEALMTRVSLDPALADRRPHELSTGQCQRAALARALAPGPEVLLCDEPLSALDVSIQARLVALLRSIVDEGIALMLVTHDLAVASELCDDLAVMDAGRIVEEGPTRELLAAPAHDRTIALVRATRALQGR